MNTNTTKLFDELGHDFDTYKSSVRHSLEAYKADNERAKVEAAKYKNEREEYSNRHAGIMSTVRAEISKADKELADRLKTYYIPELRKAIADHVTAKPDSNFLDALGVYQRFGLKPSKFELEALLTASQGNYMALRCLKSIANASGYDLTFDTVDTYEQDIAALERLTHTPIMWCPGDMIEEARACYPDQPLRRQDGSIYGTSGRPNAIFFIGANLAVDRIHDHLAETAAKWSNAIVPEITEYKPIENDDGSTTTPEEQRAEAVKTATNQVEVNTDQTGIARQIGAEKAEADAQSAAVVEYYTR